MKKLWMCILCLAAALILAGGIFSARAEESARKEAYQEFLDGKLTVEVMPVTDGPVILEPGFYTYRELLDSLTKNYGEYGMATSYTVRYAVFTPRDGQEGEELLALLLDDAEYEEQSWIGYIVWQDDQLNMHYNATFGYRSFLEPYANGYIMSGGSDGAGASISDCSLAAPDGTVSKVYDSAHLFSSWCDDAVYYMNLNDGSMDYDAMPHLTDQSNLEMVIASFADGSVRFTATGYSKNKSVKKQEQSFVAALEKMGAAEISAEEMTQLMDVGLTDELRMPWTDLEVIPAR